MSSKIRVFVCVLIISACSGCAVTTQKLDDPVGSERSPAQAQKTVEGEDAQNLFALLISPKFAVKVNPGFEMAGLSVRDAKCSRAGACPVAPTEDFSNFSCQFSGQEEQFLSADSDTPIIVTALSQLTTCQPDAQGNAVFSAAHLRCNSHFEADDGPRGDRKYWCWLQAP